MVGSNLDRYSVFEDSSQHEQTDERPKNSLCALVAVYEAGRILTTTLSLDEIGARLLKIAQRISGFTAAVISLGNEHGQLCMLRSHGPESLRQVAHATPVAQAARRRALETKECQAFSLWQLGKGSTSVVGLCLPLVVRDRITGVLEVYGPEALAEKAVGETLESLTRQAASALENAKLYRELAERERRLENLASTLLEVRKEERRRLACDLHDGLVQVTAAAHEVLQAYVDDNPSTPVLGREKLDRALELVKQTVGEARRVIAGLRSRALDDLGLATALRLQVDSLRAEGWEVGYDEDLWEEHLPAEIEESLYWVSREALMNVRKHARTNRIHVTLTQSGNRVCLKIRDWGHGFDGVIPTEDGSYSGQQVGCWGMRERVALFGGEFTIHSRPGVGTSVVAEIPLPYATPAKGEQIPSARAKISPIRLIVADDHALAREGLRTMLASEPDIEIVGEAADGRGAFELCRRLHPDLVLMDARMPEMDGMAATRAIKTEDPATAILMLSVYENPDYLLEAVRAGATGYVIKDATKHDLVGAVRGALSGEHPLDHELAMHLLQILAGEDEPKTGPLRRSGKQAEPLLEQLTPRELEVLRLLAQGQTNRQISRKLVVSAATVKVHVEHILTKLGACDRTQAAVWASEVGLLNHEE
jgi:DNA-binding NarL/FixJ family response regulator/signal transduction histidine kinase